MTTAQETNHEKFTTINKLLDGEYLMAHISTDSAELIIPEHLKSTPSVTLKLSRLFRGGIEIAPDKIQTNLLFGSDYFSCTIPLTAIWAVTDMKGKNTVWPESTPAGVLNIASAEAATDSDSEPAPSDDKPKRPQLRRIK